MTAEVSALMKLELPVIVRLAERRMSLGEVLQLSPGSIIELEKPAEENLDLLINNRQIGCGEAVKVGENFGIRISFIGDLRQRIAAMGPHGEHDERDDAEKIAERLLAQQF